MEIQNQSNTKYYNPVGASVAIADTRKFLLNVYNWMALGLGLTALIAFGLARSRVMMDLIIQMPFLLWIIVILQLGIVIGMSAAMNKIPSAVAIGGFFLYSALTGVTFSTLFLVYTEGSIAGTFLVCAAMFASVSVLGYITKMDLSKFGTFLFMGLIGIIIASVVNIFMHSTTLYWIISYAGVLLFVGLTAYDTQKIKQMSQMTDAGSEEGKKAAVFGALTLYLDFINLFLFLLRIMGSRK